MIEHTGQESPDFKNQLANNPQATEERRILLEVMKISQLENEKATGKLNLDHLKRKNYGELTAKRTQESTNPTPNKKVPAQTSVGEKK